MLVLRLWGGKATGRYQSPGITGRLRGGSWRHEPRLGGGIHLIKIIY
jgi:hypothetical protein